ncbi:hypothetical protein V6N11_070454 [Hibiscus sabdariffa]|uniref:Uncharacterized protein n=1 Tax=Hibiscus sabdariffa TaxID=183260 RepID=A0ABR2QF17_9ROSI
MEKYKAPKLVEGPKAPNNGEGSKVSEEVKGKDPKSDDPLGKPPIIIPGSEEDHESTWESVNVLNATDTPIRAGIGKDAVLPISVTPQEGKRIILSGNSTKDKKVIEEGKEVDLVNKEMVSAIDSFICNNLKKIRVKNKRKREENEWKVQSLPFSACSWLELFWMLCYVYGSDLVPGLSRGHGPSATPDAHARPSAAAAAAAAAAPKPCRLQLPPCILLPLIKLL